MKFFPMVNISGQKVSDNIPVDTTQKWSSTKTGGYDAWEKVQDGKHIYQSYTDNNKAPTYITTHWKDIGLVNEWAYLDGIISSRSISTTTISLKYNLWDSTEMIALGGLCGKECTVTVRDAGGNIINQDTFTIGKSGAIKEMSWFYWTYPQVPQAQEEENPKTDYVKKIPKAPGQTVEVEITPLDGKACIGVLAFGELIYIGCTLEGTKREIKGSLSIGLLRSNIRQVRERKGYVRLTMSVKMIDENMKGDLDRVDEIQLILEKYLNLPIGFFGDDTGDSYSMRMYGVYERVVSSIKPRGNIDIIINSLQDITQ